VTTIITLWCAHTAPRRTLLRLLVLVVTELWKSLWLAYSFMTQSSMALPLRFLLCLTAFNVRTVGFRTSCGRGLVELWLCAGVIQRSFRVPAYGSEESKMGKGMGPVQKAVVLVLEEAAARGETELDVVAITQRTYKKLGRRSGGQGGWQNVTGGPLEHHYASVRRALLTLGEHGVAVEVGDGELG
jgi:hypothetical protein